MNDKRKKADISSLFIKGQKVPSYNFSDMKKQNTETNISHKIDLRNKK